MEIFPSPEHFWPFMVAGLALNFTPGADMTFAALSGARGGPRAGVAAALGCFTGCLAHILFAAAGLTALIAASQTAFAVVKWLGVGYLAFLAVQLALDKGRRSASPGPPADFSPRRAFRQAAVINLLNPKVGIFFLAFLPQFIEPETATPAVQILALGLVFNMTGLIVNLSVGLTSASAAARLMDNARIGRIMRFATAGILGALAVRLAVTSKN